MKKALVLFDTGNGNMYYLGLIEDNRFTQLTTTSGVISTLDVNTCMSEDCRDYIIIGYNNETYKIGDNRILKEQN